MRYVRSTGKVHATSSGQLKIIGVAFDITEDALMTAQLKAAKDEAIGKNIELELAKNRIEHNSLHDPLTGLANRRKLDFALERLTQDGRETRQKFAILHIDLDRFKEINDTLGHAAGDAMLVHASQVLSRSIRLERYRCAHRRRRVRDPGAECQRCRDVGAGRPDRRGDAPADRFPGLCLPLRRLDRHCAGERPAGSMPARC
jgi:hypothetical protein